MAARKTTPPCDARRARSSAVVASAVRRPPKSLLAVPDAREAVGSERRLAARLLEARIVRCLLVARSLLGGEAAVFRIYR